MKISILTEIILPVPWPKDFGPCDVCKERDGYLKKDGIFRCKSCGMRYAQFIKTGRYINVQRHYSRDGSSSTHQGGKG
jgi:ribosomal protein L37AE/L43A